MTSTNWILGTVLFVLLLYKDCLCLKDVKLTIDPPIVRRYQNSILFCTYDLEGAALYSVKWYRGANEFYRYTPTDHTKTKVFPFAGITVDVNGSNSTQVYLRNISEFKLSGNFSCEVTTDESSIVSTCTDIQTMLVVQLPESPPTISVGREPLDYGHILRANCSSPPSKPPASLRMTLNNVTIGVADHTSLRKVQEPTWSDLPVEMQLTEFHFKRGRLILECVAQVADIYRENAVLELDSARHPVPERVSAVDSANFPTSYIVIQLITLNWLFLINS